MRKILKYILGIVIIAMLIISIFYMLSEHDYELTELEEIRTDENFINVIYQNEEKNKTEEWNENILGILTIDKINLEASVKEGSTNDILKDYIGHMPETAKYDGNIGLAAHNRGTANSYFARINELEIGDKIIYKTKFYERTYVIKTKVVIYDTDWNYLQSTKDNRITMITCIKDKPNQRLCIQAIEEK